MLSILDESLSLKACRCPHLPTRDDACMDFLDVIRQMGEDLENIRIFVSGRQCLQPLSVHLITVLQSVPLLISIHSPY